MSVFNPSNAPASPPERRAASDCGGDGSVGFPGSAAYILFDLDGTLTDPKEGITRCVQYALSKFGIQAECDALTNFIGPPLEESFGRFYGLSPADSKKAVGYYRERFTDVGIFENGVIDGIPELLLALSGAGAVLALATSKPQVFAARILEKYNLSTPLQRRRGQRAGRPPQRQGGGRRAGAGKARRAGQARGRDGGRPPARRYRRAQERRPRLRGDVRLRRAGRAGGLRR